MICPHCGMDTGNNEKCIHCSRSTEFARKTKIRPEGIPNLGELCCDTSLQSTSVACRKSIVLIMSVIIAVLAVITGGFYCVRYNQMLSAGNTEISSTEPSQESTLPTEHQIFIYLYLNYSGQTEDDLYEAMMFGQTIPVLPDMEDRIFVEWNTERDGTGMVFRAGDPFMIHISEDLPLYAQWEIKPEETMPVLTEKEDTTVPEITTQETSEAIDEQIVQDIETEETTTGLNQEVNSNE